MFRSVLLDKESWTQHVKLDPVTGLDPPGIKIRAAQGRVGCRHNDGSNGLTILYFRSWCSWLLCHRVRGEKNINGTLDTKFLFLIATGYGQESLKTWLLLDTTATICILQAMIGDSHFRISKSGTSTLPSLRLLSKHQNWHMDAKQWLFHILWVNGWMDEQTKW